MLPTLELLTGEKPQICERLTEIEYATLIDNMQNFCSFDVAKILTDITPAELGLMYCSALHNKRTKEMLTVAEAAAQLHVSVPAVSRTLKNLDKKGFVTRAINENDRRSVYISLSERGMDVLLNNIRRYENTIGRILMHFTDEELRMMIQLQSKFIKAASDVVSEA